MDGKSWLRFVPAIAILAAAVGILTFLAMPGMIVCHGMPPVRSLAVNRLKQIGVLVKIYAVDHHGNYPGFDIHPATANAAFRQLFDSGILKDETVFMAPFPAVPWWKRLFARSRSPFRKPDNRIDGTNCLASGEVAIQYFWPLNEDAEPNWPLLCTFTRKPPDYDPGAGWFIAADALDSNFFGGSGVAVGNTDGSISFRSIRGLDRILLGGTNFNSRGQPIRVLRPEL